MKIKAVNHYVKLYRILCLLMKTALGIPVFQKMLFLMKVNFDYGFIEQILIYLFLETPKQRVHFYVFCPTCKALKTGKLRVRCHFCKSGAFTVHSDPQSWTDVLEPKRITGLCENSPELCSEVRV